MITLLESSSFLNGINGVGSCLPHAEVRLSEKNHQVLIKSSSLCIRRGKRTFATNEWLQTPDFGKFDSSGNLIVQDCNGTQTVVASAPFPSSAVLNYTVNGMSANGAPCSLTTFFSVNLLF